MQRKVFSVDSNSVDSGVWLLQHVYLVVFGFTTIRVSLGYLYPGWASTQTVPKKRYAFLYHRIDKSAHNEGNEDLIWNEL